jgi:crossover junction endodeoxyribonuclease RuvC
MPLIRIIGIDPGTKVTGYGVIDFDTMTRRMLYVECGTFELSAPTMEGKLNELRRDLTEVVTELRPTLAGLERAHVGAGPHAALRLSEARGVVIAVLTMLDVDVEQYQPSHAKKVVTSDGHATKPAVRSALMRLLGLSSAPSIDASDGLAQAVCRAIHFRTAAA